MTFHKQILQTIKYIKCPKQHKYLKIIIYKKFSKQLLPSKHSSWWRSIEDVSCLCFQKMSSRRIYLSWSYAFKTSSRRFQGIFKTSCKSVFKASLKRLEDVLKMSSKRLQDLLQRCLHEIFKTFSRHIVKLNCSC